jgi:selenocysteine-specific translation elongation factor
LTNLYDYFDATGFVTKPVRFETITDLETHAREFYEQIFLEQIQDTERLRKSFSNYVKTKNYSDEEQSLVAIALDRYFNVDGLDSFNNFE